MPCEGFSISPPDFPLRLGVISFLNTFPYSNGLKQRVPHWQVLIAPPAILAERLAQGELDASMVPAFDYLMNQRKYGILPGSCIASHGCVDSVFILSDIELTKASRIELDAHSHTSNALARLLLQGPLACSHIAFEKEPLDGEAERHPTTCVRIGNRAMQMRKRYKVCVDLGEVWYRWQNLPFVFALWATRVDAPWDEVGRFLCKVRDENLANIEERLLARPEALPPGIDHGEAARYLREKLWFDLGPREMQGLMRFGELLGA